MFNHKLVTSPRFVLSTSHKTPVIGQSQINWQLCFMYYFSMFILYIWKRYYKFLLIYLTSIHFFKRHKYFQLSLLSLALFSEIVFSLPRVILKVFLVILSPNYLLLHNKPPPNLATWKQQFYCPQRILIRAWWGCSVFVPLFPRP